MKFETQNPGLRKSSGVPGKNIDLIYAENSITNLEPRKQAFSVLAQLQEGVITQNLTQCLEILETLGFHGDDTLIFLLSTAQQLGRSEG